MRRTMPTANRLPISAARVVVCPGRNFVTVKVETADGLYGLGDATLNGRELAVASYLNDHVIPCLIGRDAHLSIPNFGLQEYMRHTPETDAVFPHAYQFAAGSLHPGNEPGLGVDLDETLAATYPYQRAYLPVNRLEDGSMTNW
jgi:L-alanine-DL-glutamate epimerase-like enolase superfamily enzyme